MTLEEEHLTGKISSNDFLYLLLARTERDIIQTDLSQSKSDSVIVEYYVPLQRIPNQTQGCDENRKWGIQFLTGKCNMSNKKSVFNRLSTRELRKIKLAQEQAVQSLPYSKVGRESLNCNSE